jgi:hypothetical protein
MESQEKYKLTGLSSLEGRKSTDLADAVRQPAQLNLGDSEVFQWKCFSRAGEEIYGDERAIGPCFICGSVDNSGRAGAL